MDARRVTFTVRGMHCSACTKRVERALAQVKGVRAVTVDLAAEQASVEYAPEQTGEAQLKAVVCGLGFQVPDK